MTERQVLAALLGIALLFAALSALGASVTFANVCRDARYVQRGPDLQIWCGSAVWLTYRGCERSRVLRDGAGNVKVVCGVA